MGLGAAGGALLAAGLGAAGSIGGALISSGASQSAANTQAGAATNAANEQLQAAQLAANTQLGIFGQTQANLAPYMQAGQGALTQLQSLLGLSPSGAAGNNGAALQALQNTPGYQFSLQQGQTALDQSAASRGLLLSGNQLAASQQYGQNLAQTQYQSVLAPYQSLYGIGENAAAGVGNIGANTGSSVAGTITGGANSAAQSQLAAAAAAASGTVGSANAITSGLNSVLNSSNLNYLLNGGGVQENVNVTPEVQFP